MKVVSTVSVLCVLMVLLISDQPTYPLQGKIIPLTDSQVVLDSLRRKNMVTLFEIKDIISTEYRLKSKK